VKTPTFYHLGLTCLKPKFKEGANPVSHTVLYGERCVQPIQMYMHQCFCKWLCACIWAHTVVHGSEHTKWVL